MAKNPPPILRFEMALLSTYELFSDVREFSFAKPKGFTFQSGQFITILFEQNGQKFRRPYSIASTPDEKNIRFCIKFIPNGPGCTHLWALKKGDTIKCIGPLGVFTVDENDAPVVMISTGTGVAPFASAIPKLLESNKQITLLCGYRHAPLYHNTFADLAAKNKHFTYIPTITQPAKDWKSNVGRVQTQIDAIIKPDAQYYICGLYDMIKEVVKLLSEKGVAKDHIHFERYD
ncbi:MAG TPA: FAD-dependent oxidoreductase [Acidobacteriota bacterium]|nr:FAD-dependent oxidoreductase [Acidobacteriota bacterium]